MSPTPCGVVWDLGNVLIDWQPERAVAEGLGSEESRRFFGAADLDFHDWNRRLDAGELSWDDAEAEIGRTHPHWLAHVRAYRSHFAATLDEVPGSRALVADLRAAGVRQWGLTNWSAELYLHAPERFDVLGLLEDVLVSGREGVAKPDPRIYRLLVARTGLAPDELVFLDDKPGNVEAARAEGLQGLVFTDADTARADLRSLGLPV